MSHASPVERSWPQSQKIISVIRIMLALLRYDGGANQCVLTGRILRGELSKHIHSRGKPDARLEPIASPSFHCAGNPIQKLSEN